MLASVCRQIYFVCVRQRTDSVCTKVNAGRDGTHVQEARVSYVLVGTDEQQTLLEKNMKSMKLAKVSRAVGLALLAGLASSYAVAGDNGFYLGGNLGRTDATIDDQGISDRLATRGFTMLSISDDEKDNGYKLFGGYQFTRHFALEGGYFDLGKFGFTADTDPAGTYSGDIKIRGWNLDAVGLVTLGDHFSLIGRYGMQWAESRDTFSGTGADHVLQTHRRGRDRNDKYGLGVQYDFTPRFSIRMEDERYRINDAVGNIGDVDMVSLGLLVRFGGGRQHERHEAAVAPQPAAVAVVAPMAEVVVVPVGVKTQEYCSILDIQFEIDNDDMQREEKERLGVIGTFLKTYPDTTAIIEGHTDDVGTVEYNQALSQRRADSVVAYLQTNFFIAPARLTARGYGEMHPTSENVTKEGKRANRRIDAVIACATDIAGLQPIPARVTMALEIEFDPYKYSVMPQYREELRKVATFLKNNPSTTATVEGHAGKLSGVGKDQVTVTPELAMETSTKRAESVVDYLVNEFGVARSRLHAEGFGQTRRVAYGTTLEGQQENRRVNIIINYDKKATTTTQQK